MLICGSQRAFESGVVDFVTAETVGIPPIFTPGEGRKTVGKPRNPTGLTQIQFSKPLQKLGKTQY